MEHFIKIHGVYYHESNLFRIRERKGRNLEVQFKSIPYKWKSTGTKNLDEAESFAKNMLMHRCMPTEDVKNELTFGAFAKDFFARRDKDSFFARNEKFGKVYKHSFYTSNQSRLDNHLMPYLKDRPLSLITSADLEEVYLTSSSVFEDSKILADGTRNSIRQTAVYIFSEAKRMKLIEENPCDDAERIIGRFSKKIGG